MNEFERVIRGGGVVLFPSDTVYGLACSPDNAGAVERLYRLKEREADKAAAVMFFSLDAALAALPELGNRTRAALQRLMPGGVTVLLPNPRRRWPLASQGDPATIGIRVVTVPVIGETDVAVVQSSANLSGGLEARRLSDVPGSIRGGVDVAIDGGELPGTASTVIDLRSYEDGGVGVGAWSIVRDGSVEASVIAAALDGQYHFDPVSYATVIRQELPEFDRLQDELIAASGAGASRILELGTGTGETARRLLERHPDASLVGIDESPSMLETARRALPGERVRLLAARLQDPLPAGPFELVASALAVHHLDRGEKADLFARVRSVLAPGGRFTLADVVVPSDSADAVTELTAGYDKPSSVAEQLSWLADAGFNARVTWSQQDLAVILAEAVC
jgi:tRNA threonylcarbamoyl adenosine modification protein (Sua5/YciO/YrdC/YwlC family)